MNLSARHGTLHELPPPGTSRVQHGDTFILSEVFDDGSVTVRAGNPNCPYPGCAECEMRSARWSGDEWVFRFEAQNFGGKVARLVNTPPWAVEVPQNRPVGRLFRDDAGTEWFFNVIAYASLRSFDGERPAELVDTSIRAFLAADKRFEFFLAKDIDLMQVSVLAQIIQPELDAYIR